jgi:hypothetical protein
MVRVTVAPGWSTVCGAGLWVSTARTTLTVVVVTEAWVVGDDVSVEVVAGGALPTEKQAQVRPAAWMAWRAAPKLSPTTTGTSAASP